MLIKQELRQAILQKRSRLDKTVQKQVGDNVADTVQNLTIWQNSQRIGFYYPMNGEVDTRPTIKLAWEQNKQVYLPLMNPALNNSLQFVLYTADTPLASNKWGVPEPEESALKERHAASFLDIIIMPLVAYDPFKNRLGMGGGCYDKTLAFKAGATHATPYCLGLAYAFQAIKALLPVDPWDIPMDDVICLKTD